MSYCVTRFGNSNSRIIDPGNQYEIIHDRINLYHKLIAFFVTYQVSSRGAICHLTFSRNFFKGVIAK